MHVFRDCHKTREVWLNALSSGSIKFLLLSKLEGVVRIKPEMLCWRWEGDYLGEENGPNLLRVVEMEKC